MLRITKLFKDTKKINFHKRNQGSTLIELITVVAMISTITSVVTPVYLNSLQRARELADEVQLVNASTLASTMLVMEDAHNGDVLYYTDEATLVPTKYQLNPYGQKPENENSVVKITINNDSVYAEWTPIK